MFSSYDLLLLATASGSSFCLSSFYRKSRFTVFDIPHHRIGLPVVLVYNEVYAVPGLCRLAPKVEIFFPDYPSFIVIGRPKYFNWQIYKR
jgi:hypothetical protein